jgi:hypothetical protein
LALGVTSEDSSFISRIRGVPSEIRGRFFA